MQKRFGINAFWLKLAMTGLMVPDHLYQYGWPVGIGWHYAARLVAPVFAFFVAEGMCRTRNRRAYILRLAGFGLAMQLVNWFIGKTLGLFIPNNIFLPLAAGAAIIVCIDRIRKGGHVPFYAGLSALLLLAAHIFMEGNALLPMTIAIFYIFRSKRPLMYMCYILFASLLYLPQYFFFGQINSQFYMIFAVLLIMLYNGERGPNTLAAKYFFYIFYPWHIWAIVSFTTLN